MRPAARADPRGFYARPGCTVHAGRAGAQERRPAAESGQALAVVPGAGGGCAPGDSARCWRRHGPRGAAGPAGAGSRDQKTPDQAPGAVLFGWAPGRRRRGRRVLGGPGAAGARPGFDCGVALVAGVEFAREWSNRPANHAPPSLLADAAKTLGRLPHIQCKVHGPAQVRRLGMGAFVAVARGSEQPLRFIELRYSAAAKDQAPIVLVGKGITFDSGGISIKPAPEMDEMKFDMCGAASVLGVFRALGELQPAINVLGLIPACENLPDGRAIKPGDVVTSMSGQTIEILNTDAEGRLILCDALTYAARFKPAAVIDIATLTGACVVALAGVRSGLFANDDDLAVSLYEAGEAALDPCWRMPLDDDYADGLKSHFADMGNTAGRSGGAITAAKFLQKFVAGMRWAHLDIAGIAYKSGPAKGATGRPVGLLVHYLLAQAEAMAMAQQAPVAPAARPAAKRTGRSQGGLKRTAP